MSSAEHVRVLPDDRLSIKHVGSNASSASSKRRSARVKRTIRRQRGASTPDSSFTDSLVSALANVAQAFLYPEGTLQKENRSKNAVNTSTSTADMSDEAHDSSVVHCDEEETFESSYANTTLLEGRSLDTRTPPPTLVGSEAAAFVSSSVKRPIPVSSPRSSFDPVFPKETFRHVSPSAPIARMRAPPPQETEPPQQQQASGIGTNDDQSRYSENFVADKHRKWRRQIKLQQKRLQQQQQKLQQQRRREEDDDASLLTTCGHLEGRRSKSKSSGGGGGGHRRREPVDILAALIRAPCAKMEDAMVACEEGAVSSDEEQDEENSLLGDDDDDDDSTYYGPTEYTCDQHSDFTRQSEYTHADRQSDFTGTSDYMDDHHCDYTGGTSEFTDDRHSDFAGGSQYSDASSARLNAIKTPSSFGSRTSTQTHSFSPSSSSMLTGTPSPPSRGFEEKPKNTDKNFIKAFVAVGVSKVLLGWFLTLLTKFFSRVRWSYCRS